MEKKKYYKLFYTVSVLLIIGFVIRLTADYLKYDLTEHYVPFYVYIIVRIVEFLLPSFIIFLFGRKNNKNCE